MRIRLLKKNGDAPFYFQFVSNNGDVFLDSQGYTSKEARDNGIESVKENSALSDRYQDGQDGNDHFYILKAGNNVEIGRSPNLSSSDSRNELRQTFISDASNANDNDDYATDGVTDDYKPLAFYAAEVNNNTEFESFEKEGEFYFVYNANNTIQMISEGYKTANSRDNGIASVTKNKGIAERYKVEQHENGKYYFNLKAGNHQEIATSVWFDSQGQIQDAIDLNTGVLTQAVYEGRLAQMNVEASTKVKEEKPKKKRKKRKKTAPKGERVYLKNGSYHWNDLTYQTMKSTNNKYYFVFRNKEDKAVLLNSNVRGYNSEEEVDAAIENVLKYGPNEANFQGKTTSNGKYYFHLNDDNGKSIGKSFFYNEEDEMKAFAGLFLGDLAVGASEGDEEGTTNVKKTNKMIDDYLPCGDYSGPDGFHKFFREDKNEYYFAFNKNGKTVLRSEGYTTEAARDNGIESVKKNAPIEKRWTKGTAMDGKYHYFALKAGNHQEIARSCYSKSAGNMVGFIASFMPQPELVAASMPVAEVKKAAKKVDDYLPCGDYDGPNGFHKFFREDRGEYYFAFNKDGKTLLRSEGYTTEAARDNGVESVKKNAPIEKRWVQGTAMDGKYHYYALKAGNHQEIARSCYHKSAGALVGFLGAFMPSPNLVAAVAPVVAAAPVIAAVAAAPTPPPSPPKKKEKVVAAAAAVPPAAAASSGCWKFWWLPLLLLGLLALLWYKGCFNQNNAAVADTDPVVTTKVQPAAEPTVKAADPVVEYIETKVPITLPEINYDYNKSNILTEEHPELTDVYNKMTKFPDMVVEVGSHTDVRGNNSYNQRLSKRRAREARDWLVRKGVDAKRLLMKGYGETQPRNKCREGVKCSDDEHRVNRRTEFKIVSGTNYEVVKTKKEVSK